jgi:ubiquinone/menaquinone biosynthesis C-methylase UbiE
MPVGSVYDRAAEDWDASAGLVYGPLGARLVACSPVGLAGKLVLDAGCGTGAAARAAAARGARVMGLDRSLPMARQGTGHEISMLAGDLLALPFCSNAFDVALAGFVINHVPPAMGWPNWSGSFARAAQCWHRRGTAGRLIRSKP